MTVDYSGHGRQRHAGIFRSASVAGHVQPADRTDAQQGHTVLLQGLRSGNKRYCSTASERSSLHFVDDHHIMLPRQVHSLKFRRREIE